MTETMHRSIKSITYGLLLLMAFLLVVSAISTASAAAPVMSWDKTYGAGTTSESDAYSIQQTTDGGYIIGGDRSSPDENNYDMYLLKVDSNGNEQWNKSYGGSNLDFANAARQTSDGGYIIGGKTDSFGNGPEDIYLVKTDSNGNVQWNKTYGGDSYDWANDVRQTSDGGYILLGSTYSYGDGNLRWYLVKTDSSGNMLWNKTYDCTEYGYGFSVRQTSDGGYALAGEVWSGYSGTYDMGLVKTDGNGNELWNKTYGQAEYDVAQSIQQTSDGGYILGGWAGFFNTTGSFCDFYLVKTDGNGNELWNKTFGGANDDMSNSVQQTSDGGYILAGYTSSYGNGSYDFYLVKADASGNKLWDETFGGTGKEEGFSVQQASDGGYIVAGRTTASDNYPHIYLAKTGSDVSLAPGASYVSDTIPSTMVTGQTYTVSVTMRNNGTMAWTNVSGIKLGSVNNTNGDATKYFGTSRYAVATGVTVNPGDQYTFTFTMRATSTPGDYHPGFGMVWETHYWFGETINKTVTVVKPDAQYVSDTIPATMVPGQTYTVNVTMRNNGSMPWTNASGIKLGSVNNTNGDAYKYFGTWRYGIPAGTTVNPGSQYTWTFTMIATNIPGTYHPAYGMAWENHYWFGPTVSKTVTVMKPDAQYVSDTIPDNMTAGRTYNVSVTMRNNGSMPWTNASGVKLGSVNNYNGDAYKYFGTWRYGIPNGTTVNPGDQYTWTFAMKAPNATGTYHPAYGMAWENHYWFGQTINKTIIVSTIPTV